MYTNLWHVDPLSLWNDFARVGYNLRGVGRIFANMWLSNVDDASHPVYQSGCHCQRRLQELAEIFCLHSHWLWHHKLAVVHCVDGHANNLTTVTELLQSAEAAKAPVINTVRVLPSKVQSESFKLLLLGKWVVMEFCYQQLVPHALIALRMLRLASDHQHVAEALLPYLQQSQHSKRLPPSSNQFKKLDSS